ncbi:hypothetical protein N7449_003098 [Penicillium cf. viridicatum]|uniref:Uncharacterized protein n=1 Tax=Penicillium cf. viridicatum TaxID=2972119 RepID=A0A9W9MWL5_9EURO|nr:hypothetical protein N7449_003098 [Penicillium cf. viridicatum]
MSAFYAKSGVPTIYRKVLLEFYFEACFTSLLLISQRVKFENTHSHHKPRIHSLSKSLRFQRKKRTRYLGHGTFHIHDCTCQGYHLMT